MLVDEGAVGDVAGQALGAVEDADEAERPLCNLARRLEHEAPGVAGSILEGLGDIFTVIRLGLPHQLHRSLGCANAIENALGTAGTLSRNVKRRRSAEMALRWTATGLREARKTVRRPRGPTDSRTSSEAPWRGAYAPYTSPQHP